MPSPVRTLEHTDVVEFVAATAFAPTPGGRVGQVGLELEWITAQDDGTPATPDDIAARLPRPLPGASRVSFEPGGQLELSGPPAADLGAAIAAMRADVAASRAALAPIGVRLGGAALDHTGMRARFLDEPRYRAMEEFLDLRWPAGITMMRQTASIQVNLDSGSADELPTRWRRAHALAPLLVATFANSPFDAAGNVTGWCSNRFALWGEIDPSRTRPSFVEGLTPTAAFTQYALDARVMMIWTEGPGPDGHGVATVPRPDLTFGDWVEHGHPHGYPTLDDLAYHLTTLFPPVRPRGWLELRVIDALPDEWWPVAAALTTALLDDADAADAADAALRRAPVDWSTAARCGLTDAAIHAVAAECFTAAGVALPRLGADDATAAAFAEFRARFVDRGRSPAHDLLDSLGRPDARTSEPG